MNEMQQQAFTIYMDSATFENGYTPISFSRLAKEVPGTSRSSIGRWAIKFKWKELLEKKVSATLVEEGSEAKSLIEQSAIEATSQKSIDDFKLNEALKNDSYVLLNAQLKKYFKTMEDGSWLDKDGEKFVLKVLELTSNREDKLLDRQALISASKLLKSEDVLKSLQDEMIDVEVE